MHALHLHVVFVKMEENWIWYLDDDRILLSVVGTQKSFVFAVDATAIVQWFKAQIKMEKPAIWN